jgi:adenylyltransferase/sulfurtransferase
VRVDEANLPGLLVGRDLVIDAVDNLATRLAVNQACVHARLPLMEVSATGFDTQLTLIAAGGKPCLRCLYGPSAASRPARPAGAQPILGAVAGVAGCLAAREAIKFLLGLGALPVGRMQIVEGLSGAASCIDYAADPACPVCGGK